MLAPWKKIYDKPRQHIKNRDITLVTKICLVKTMFFLAVMYRCENWTIQKAMCQTIDAFKLCCWKRFSRLPWSKEIKPENTKEINPELIGRTDNKAEAPIFWSRLIGKDPDAGKD